ncbi:MAG: Gx transporter family protein [Clostridiales bacterium]|nr:Gx transporter family protein [Clostridiales bacterium]
MSTKRLAADAVLAAFALVVFVIEAQIPVPSAIPGVKLGLANAVTLVTMSLFGKKDAAAVLFTRLILGSFFTGTAASLIYSVSGGIFCFFSMCFFFRFLTGNRLWAVSVFGAVAHNTGQLLAASFMLGSTKVFLYFPALLLSAILTGVFTGLCAQYAVAGLKSFKLK